MSRHDSSEGAFYVFAVEWEANAIRFFVDDGLFVTRSRSDLQSWLEVGIRSSFLVLNAAAGGDGPGNPDPAAIFPQTMLVDHIRVYQRSRE
jgi:hypothetical protein